MIQSTATLPAMRAQHDALGKDVLALLLEDEGMVEKEKLVAPKDSQRIELVNQLCHSEILAESLQCRIPGEKEYHSRWQV